MLPFSILLQYGNKVIPPIGQYVLKQTAQTQNMSWVVPESVNVINVVCVGHGAHGGGGLSYRNNIVVTPGETLTISFTVSSTKVSNGGSTRLLRGSTVLCIAYAGGYDSTVSNTSCPGGLGGKNANIINDGGGNGGAGSNIFGSGPRMAGGGAGGYNGNGGNFTANGTASTAPDTGSGGGSGSRSYSTSGPAAPVTGGNVGLYGLGADGTSPTTMTNIKGNDGSVATVMCGGGANTFSSSYNAGIRIIWGTNRSYPNTNTQDMS